MECLQTSKVRQNLFQEIRPSQQEWIYSIDTLTNQQELSESNFVNLVQSPFQDDEVMSKEPEETQQVSSQTNRTPSASSYEKNICAYISKKIVLYFLDKKNIKLVHKLCRLSNCSIQDSLNYYKQRSKQIFGINHLTKMITPENEEETNMKKMFCAFLNWFLRNKYMYYLLKFGKMEDKDKYVQFKNYYLLYIADISKPYSHYF